ncbi:hypothetical protein PAPYR_5952 [Paratrimastix pyriformis]|uniref:Uncharacterized protein n=1 Tax=Paratrimastix pyriformis TaxID=342808 RepID=A0ABQ8UGL5_9EUKA|nr:hypothetical protein PAPYR_5952 [Paratrimastix pyriformis]
MGLREEDFHITFTFQSAGCKQIFHYPSGSRCCGASSGHPAPCPRDDKQKLNILVFGIAGAGKSSLINGFATILSTNPATLSSPWPCWGRRPRHAHPAAAPVRRGGRTFNFNLWDTWGLTAETWNSMELKRVMEGQFPSGWEMSQMDAESVALLAQGASTRHLRAPTR